MGNYTANHGFDFVKDGFFFERESTITFDFAILIDNEPLSIGVNISSINSADPITYIGYQIEGITSWIQITWNYESISLQTCIYTSFDHDSYYDLLNNENNTVIIKIQNNQNVTLQQSLNFKINTEIS